MTFKVVFFFHNDLYYCYKYSNPQCQNDIFKKITKSKVQKQVAKYGFGCIFHDFKYSKYGLKKSLNS